jgi:excisionase family DNA binding protein
MKQGASRARLVTPADAADQLCISLRTIYELMSTGALASIKLPPGGKTSPRRIEQAEIDAFIERNRVKVTAVPKAAAS